jgi:hypothetical protein
VHPASGAGRHKTCLQPLRYRYAIADGVAVVAACWVVVVRRSGIVPNLRASDAAAERFAAGQIVRVVFAVMAFVLWSLIKEQQVVCARLQM